MQIFIICLIILFLWNLKNHFTIKELRKNLDEVELYGYELREKMDKKNKLLKTLIGKNRIEFLRSANKLKVNKIYHITTDCISCGSCVDECKVNAITEGDPYQIDPEICNGCRACVKICPVNACVEA